MTSPDERPNLAAAGGDTPQRGRRPGTIPRTTCPTCGRDCAVRANGQPFRHRKFLPNGYTRSLGYCPGGERSA